MTDAAATAQDAEGKGKVFVSYSRKDMAFVDRLDGALAAHGFKPLIDRTEIYAFEDWWKRIETLIVGADSIVFAISPDSVVSEVALKEVAFAATLNKRFAPIIINRGVHDDAVPEPLRRLNWIDFSDAAQFDASTERLIEALSTDIEWVRKHTEFGEQSRRWALAGRPGPRGLLLRSPFLEEAERWIAARPHGAPPPTPETQDFIALSRSAATRRQRITVAGTMAVALLSGSLAISAVLERNRAKTNEARAVASEQLAKSQEKKATEARDQALTTQSRLLAERASRLTEQGDTLNAMLLSLEAFRSPDDVGPERYDAAAEKSLADAIYVNPLKSILSAADSKFVSAAFTADGAMLVAVTEDGKVSFRSIDGDGRLGETKDVPTDFGAVKSVVANPKRPVLLLRGADGGYFAWNYQTRQKLAGITGNCSEDSADFRFDPSGEMLLAFCQSVRIFNLATGRAVEKAGPFDTFSLAGNGSRFATLGAHLLEVRDTKSGDLLKSWKTAEGVQGVAVSFDGSQVLTEEYAGVTIWDARTGAAKPLLRTDQARTFEVYAHPTMPLFVASGDEGAKTWNIAHGAQIEADNGQFAAFLPNGMVAFTTDDNIVLKRYLTEGHTGTEFGVAVATLHVAGGHKWQAVSADGGRVVTLTDGGDLYLWGTGPPMLLRAIDGDDKRLGAPLALSGNGKMLATRTSAGVNLWDAETFALIKAIPVKGGDTQWSTLRLDQDGKRLLYRDANGGYDAVEIASWNSLLPKQRPATMTAGDLSPDGEVAAFGLANRIRIWRLADQSEKQCDFPDEVVKLVFTASSGSLVAGTKGGAIFLVDTQNCAAKKILSYAYTKDDELTLQYREGRVLAAFARRVQVWDEAADKVVFDSSQKEWPVFDSSAADQNVIDIAGTRVLVGKANDQYIGVFDLATRTDLLRFRADINDCCDATDLKVLPANDRVVVQWSERGSFRLRLWRLFATVDALRTMARASVAACLSPDERHEFGLPPEPPAWCIEMGKRPYQSDGWKTWLKAKRANLEPPLPDGPDWQTWLAAHPIP